MDPLWSRQGKTQLSLFQVGRWGLEHRKILCLYLESGQTRVEPEAPWPSGGCSQFCHVPGFSPFPAFADSWWVALTLSEMHFWNEFLKFSFPSAWIIFFLLLSFVYAFVLSSLTSVFHLCPFRWPLQRGAGGVGHQQNRGPGDLEDRDDGWHSHRSSLSGNREQLQQMGLGQTSSLMTISPLQFLSTARLLVQWLHSLLAGCFPPDPSTETGICWIWHNLKNNFSLFRVNQELSCSCAATLSWCRCSQRHLRSAKCCWSLVGSLKLHPLRVSESLFLLLFVLLGSCDWAVCVIFITESQQNAVYGWVKVL